MVRSEDIRDFGDSPAAAAAAAAAAAGESPKSRVYHSQKTQCAKIDRQGDDFASEYFAELWSVLHRN